MKKTMILLSALTLVAFWAVAAQAGVKITLKNGRTIVVEDCRDLPGSLICEMQGGTFEIEKKDIESIQDVKYSPRSSDDSTATEETSSDEKKQEEGSPKAQTAVKDGAVVKGLSPDQLKRLNSINEKKTALKAEREKIAQERDRLNEEIKKAGVIRKQEDIDAFRRRVAESEAKIREFNEEVKRLNDEEGRLLGESPASKQQEVK